MTATDPIALQRFVDGDDTVPLNRRDKHVLVHEMDRRGVAREEIRQRLRLSWATLREFLDSNPPEQLGGGYGR